MRAETVHVTDHALLRWKQRVSKNVNVHDIIDAVKASKVIKKKEPLPYSMPRWDGSVYTFNNGIMFILECVSIDEYKLITMIADDLACQRVIKKRRPRPSQKKRRKMKKQKIQDAVNVTCKKLVAEEQKSGLPESKLKIAWFEMFRTAILAQLSERKSQTFPLEVFLNKMSNE